MVKAWSIVWGGDLDQIKSNIGEYIQYSEGLHNPNYYMPWGGATGAQVSIISRIAFLEPRCSIFISNSSIPQLCTYIIVQPCKG